jgi:saccharopine dehydrogenase-like NADP-dependent oxidoreductase
MGFSKRLLWAETNWKGNSMSKETYENFRVFYDDNFKSYCFHDEKGHLHRLHEVFDMKGFMGVKYKDYPEILPMLQVVLFDGFPLPPVEVVFNIKEE